MTEPTEADASSAQLERIARLRARRGQTAATGVDAGAALTEPPAPARRRRTRHVAPIGRVVAAGLGATTMFGIVGLLGLNRVSATTQDAESPTIAPQVQPPAPTPIRVVVHRVASVSPTPTSTDAVPDPASDVASDPASDVAADVAPDEAAARPSPPVVLTANPVVQTVTVTDAAPARPATASPAPAAPAAPAPKATTRGSG